RSVCFLQFFHLPAAVSGFRQGRHLCSPRRLHRMVRKREAATMRRICRLPKPATTSLRRRLFRAGIAAALCLAALPGLALLGLGSRAGAQVLPANYVEAEGDLGLTGTGSTTDTTFLPGIATWLTDFHIRGGRWPANIRLDAYLRGPLNTL